MSDTEKKKLQIGITLEGDEIDRFEQYKKAEKIRQNSPAALKIVLERLATVSAQADTVTV